MNKTELVGAIAEETGVAKKDTEAVIKEFFSQVTNELGKGEKIQIIGFGTFEVRDRSARKGKNPRTGEELDIPAQKIPAFKAGKALKDAVNK